VNDSAMPLGSNRDRHANIGEGLMGDGLGTFLAHPEFQHLSAYLETAGADGHGPGVADLEAMRGMHKRGVARRKRREKKAATSVAVDTPVALGEPVRGQRETPSAAASHHGPSRQAPRPPANTNAAPATSRYQDRNPQPHTPPRNFHFCHTRVTLRTPVPGTGVSAPDMASRVTSAAAAA